MFFSKWAVCDSKKSKFIKEQVVRELVVRELLSKFTGIEVPILGYLPIANILF